jgi:conjugative transposon TraN protein
MQVTIRAFYTIVLAIFACRASAQADFSTFHVSPIHAECIPVTTSQITSIIFPVKVQPAGKGSRDIRAQRVKGTENVLMIQAVRDNIPTTNITVIGANGRLYSFMVEYTPTPKALNFEVVDTGGSALGGEEYGIRHPVIFSNLPADESTLSADADSVVIKPTFLHARASSEEMNLSLNSIYIKDNVMWLVLKVSNYSELEYKRDYLEISIIDNKRGKRTAIQEKRLNPIFCSPKDIIRGMAFGNIVVGVRPFTVPDHKSLVIQISEADGGRPLALKVRSKTILKARLY